MAIAVVGMVAASVYYLRPWVVTAKPVVATYTVVRSSPDTRSEVQYEFVSAALVWAVAVDYSGDGNSAGSYRLFRSVDGSRTWTRERQGKTSSAWTTESSLRFVDPATGFLAADDPLVLRKTSDRGRSWKAVRLPTPDNVLTIHFIDGRHGWVTAGTLENSWRLYSTDDGGSSWTRPIMVPADLMLEPLFRDAGEGWAGAASSDHPHLYRSGDGGQSWAARDLPTPPGLAPGLHFSSFVRLVPGGGLLALVEATTEDNSVGVFVFKSLDGGASWMPLAGPTHDGAFMFASVFQDATNWWLIAESDLYKTSDGGETWIHAPGVEPPNLFLSRILDSRHAWGQFYDDQNTSDVAITSDGGATWTRIKAPGRK